MTRLINEIRNSIRDSLLEHRFKSAVLALEARQAELARVTYEDCFKASDRKRMDDLPKGWVYEQTYSRVQVGSETVQLNYNGSFSRYNQRANVCEIGLFISRDLKDVHRRIPYSKSGNTVKIYGNAPGDEIGYNVHQYLRSVESLSEEIGAARRQTDAALRSFHTIAKMIEAWPEVMPFIPEKSVPSLLPVVPVASLNELLKLPV